MSRQEAHQSRPPDGPILAVLLACILFIPINASAAEQVGRVLIAFGSVTAEQSDASARGLGGRDPIYAGDRIRTGTRGRVQIRFEDGAMVDLEPNSVFEVTEYGSDEDARGGSAVMSFLRGAMRTITGAIGGGSGDTYQMNTTVATIGVRGTAYELEYCDAECVDEGGQAGLYGQVDDGEVEVDGPGGIGGFSEGQYFFVAEDGAPERIVAPPDGILDSEGEDEAGGGNGQSEDASVTSLGAGVEDTDFLTGGGTDLLDPDFESGEDWGSDPRPGLAIDAAFGGAFLGSSGFAVYESPRGGDVRIDDEGRVVGAEFEGVGFVDVSGLEHTGGTTGVFDSSGELLFDISWGSWSADSSPEERDGLDGFQYAVTDPGNFTTVAEVDDLKAAGTVAAYGDPGGDTGGPPVIGSGGGNWEVSNLGFTVDFGAGVIDAAVIGLIDGTADEVISVEAGIEDSSIGSINADGSFAVDGLQDTDGIYSGEFEGRFLGTNARGALMAFEIREIDGERRIVGTRILGVLEPS